MSSAIFAIGFLLVSCAIVGAAVLVVQPPQRLNKREKRKAFWKAQTIPAGCATEAKLDFADGDYRLQPGSPAVGAGAVVSGIIAADFTGAPFAIPPSIGAYEIP